jgi:hypothetical protein
MKKRGSLGSGETEMNRFGSHQNPMKIVLNTKELCLRPLRGTAGRSFFLVADPPRVRPVGGGGIHRN